MGSSTLGIARSNTSELVAQTLPDGSLALFAVATKNVYSLNPSAAAAWECCASATTLSQLAAAMSERLNKPVSEDLAHEAVSELAAVGLVTVTPREQLGPSRRQLLKQAAEVAIPLVLVLTGAEQRAHAQGTGSTTQPPVTTPPPGTTTAPPGTTTTTTTTAPPGTTAAPTLRTFIITKFLAESLNQTEGRVPFPGVEFDVVNVTTGQVVAHLTTDAAGNASTMLIPGVSYRLVETFAPPSLGSYQFISPLPFVMLNTDGFGFDLNNVLLTTTSG